MYDTIWCVAEKAACALWKSWEWHGTLPNGSRDRAIWKRGGDAFGSRHSALPSSPSSYHLTIQRAPVIVTPKSYSAHKIVFIVLFCPYLSTFDLKFKCDLSHIYCYFVCRESPDTYGNQKDEAHIFYRVFFLVWNARWNATYTHKWVGCVWI